MAELKDLGAVVFYTSLASCGSSSSIGASGNSISFYGHGPGSPDYESRNIRNLYTPLNFVVEMPAIVQQNIFIEKKRSRLKLDIFDLDVSIRRQSLDFSLQLKNSRMRINLVDEIRSARLQNFKLTLE